MKTTYDKKANAAYIYLVDNTDIAVKFTIPVIKHMLPGLINLDFDWNGKLVGIEILNATKQLHPEVLEKAELI